MDSNIIDRLVSVINTLNKIEIKGFENIMNLGLSIQELNNIIAIINQNQQQLKINKQQPDNKPD